MNSTSKTLSATHSGDLDIAGNVLPCYNLEDGQRVLAGRAVAAAVGADRESLKDFAKRSYLKPYYTSELVEQLQNPIHFRRTGGGMAHGYTADCLANFCEAILDARANGALHTTFANEAAERAEILIRGFARVGLVALIDEATGFQAERQRDALHKVLEKFIASELLPWSKRFPDVFYREIFRLYGWPYDPESTKRSPYVGKFTNRYIYEELPPGVLEKLRELAPPSPMGRRATKFHQWLTEDLGHRQLQKQISRVVTVMKTASNIDDFKRNYSRLKQNDGLDDF